MGEEQGTADDNLNPSGTSGWQARITSDYVLGTLIVIFTVSTAIAAYLGSITDIKGDDLDLKAQNNLILGTTTFLQVSVELSEDLLSYQSYQLLKDRDPAAAALIFENEPPEMQEVLTSESNPFDDPYRDQTYQEAVTIFEGAKRYQEEANVADEQSERYERAAFILAIGLAITAWASLYDSYPKLRLVFTLLAIPCLAVGVLILLITAGSTI